ncbi:Hin recombinase [Massilia sp. CCM 8734]|uniref:Hin recombinase n=1 Tax=Massilia sp. CCM 8734 TaxID=2609283 RepID=UPI00141F5BB4|nr:Hin recombinase [Massilia sp. CCM 8734]NHZ94566.1 Hin recombinase [Massilia sp. CCM 8734]
MGRKSSLTEKQWAEIGQRLLKGEAGRVLAREHGVSEAAIRKRFGAQTKQIKDVANQLVAAETAFGALPIGAQISARTLADELKQISMHLAGAARYGAATAHRLAGIAHAKVEEIDDAGPLDDKSRIALGDIAVLTKMANGAAEIGMELMKATKDVKPDDDKPTPVAITFGVKDAKRYDDNPA